MLENSKCHFQEQKKELARMPWEKSYLETLIDELNPSGEVLEVGFALGYSATRIQSYRPKHHTIIESDPEIALKAAKWAKDNPTISVIQDRWENALPKLGRFDAIFFNDFEPEVEAERAYQRKIGNLVVQKGKELIATVKEQLPQLMSTRYSDSDLDEFFSQIGQFHPPEMAYFACELRKHEQISAQQYERLIHKYRLEKKEAPSLKRIEKRIDRMLVFLQACLKNHMVKGGRFSCFTSNPLSKYENPEFFESIITNPNVDYHERQITVDVPKSCEYYKYNEALVMLIEKQI